MNPELGNERQVSRTIAQPAIALQDGVEAMNGFDSGAVQTASGMTHTQISLQQLNEAAHSLKAIA